MKLYVLKLNEAHLNLLLEVVKEARSVYGGPLEELEFLVENAVEVDELSDIHPPYRVPHEN